MNIFKCVGKNVTLLYIITVTFATLYIKTPFNVFFLPMFTEGEKIRVRKFYTQTLCKSRTILYVSNLQQWGQKCLFLTCLTVSC